ncbi:hypothetical protein ASPBRDRAFT_243310 [Aspergillus brasiliensis CBS 101740]|uniref:T. brucei spp.-specific protein n=1 Tax=Aspergillus brasiliensis (strain CBS 101740 / IMI 381727 / IBT 21946) TaxID=767769 RepID=A0A1L9V0Y5_ASPBC|nr:hypothetical protein ASPBRDRAFT_243310 [Aspergillus brasiliensis CBS 101740]
MFTHFWMLPPGFVFQVQACRSAPKPTHVLFLCHYDRNLSHLVVLFLFHYQAFNCSSLGLTLRPAVFLSVTRSSFPPYCILILTYSGPSPAGGAVCVCVCVFVGAQPQVFSFAWTSRLWVAFCASSAEQQVNCLSALLCGEMSLAFSSLFYLDEFFFFFFFSLSTPPCTRFISMLLLFLPCGWYFIYVVLLVHGRHGIDAHVGVNKELFLGWKG